MKNNRLNTLLSLGLLSVLSAPATASESLWRDIEGKIDLHKIDKLNVLASDYRLVASKATQLEQLLLDRTTDSFDIKLPMPDGSDALFRLTYSPVYQVSLEQKYPSIRTFVGYQIDNPDNRGRFDITPHGFHGMFMYNKERAFIDPMARGNNRTHISYYKKDAKPQSTPGYDQVVKHKYIPSASSSNDHKKARTAGETLKTYRIAVAAAGEYTEFHGGTKELAQAAIVTAINRVNEVYNVDLSVQLNLVDNDAVIFTDKDTDPYDNTSDDLTANEAVMNNNIGTANYDIGHIFNTGGGGVAYLGVVCDETGKWGGVTGSTSPTADPFVIDFVSHEIGHQFGGQHSFNGTAGNCGTRSSDDAYEPGSGSTIMAYAGICDEQNLQSNSDAFFHSHSVEQMGTFITDRATCSVNSAINNQAPTVEAGNSYTIPVKTPFMLTGSATDPDDDSMSYSWEQFDTGTESTSADTMVDNGNRPLFRAWLPTSSTTRYLPRLSDVLSNTTVLGETYPTTSRTMTFKLIARDGKGNTSSDTMVVTTSDQAGPFAVTSPSSGDTWSHGINPTVTWDTAKTDQAPISCENVDILLSTDGGATFTTEVLKNTSNDGSESVTVPAVESTKARLMVKCSSNIFFAVNNDGDFSVNGISASAPQITGQSSLSVDEDNSLTIEFSHLTVSDSDNTYPDDFTMTISSGENYSVNDRVITPSANFNGTLTVPVKVNDGTNDSNTFNLSITVNAVNDAPSITATNVVSTNEDTELTLSVDMLTISDVDNTTSDMTLIATDGDNYSLNNNVLTPNQDFNGSLTVMVRVNDGQADSNQVALSVTVNPVNDAPVLTGHSDISMDEDGTLTITTSMLQISDVDNSSADMSVIVASGDNYTVNGSSITPTAEFNGTLNVPVRVNDGSADSNTLTLTVTVNEVNDAPVIASAGDVSTNEDTPFTLSLDNVTVTDVDSSLDAMTLTVMSGDNYSVMNNTVTPAQDFNGSLTVMVKVNDGSSDSNELGLTVMVNAINDNPVAVDDSYTVGQDSSGNGLDLLSNDTDVDGDTLEVTSATTSNGGTTTITSGGVSYTPASGFNGTETIAYTISDGHGGTAEATATITVTSPNSGGDDGDSSGGGGGGSLSFLLTLLLGPLAMIRRRRPAQR